MKKSFIWFIVGFVVACLMISPMAAFADAIQVSLNSVNISLNEAQVAIKGQSYTLENGTAIPYSLNYNGTVYLPIRKVSELVGKDITYDGKTSTIHISDKKTDGKTPVPGIEPKDPKEPDTTNPDQIKNPTDKNSDTEKNVETKSSFAVINSFPKVTNANGITVNQLEGLVDGGMCDMLTSKKDMISFSVTEPALYNIKYKDYVITEINLVSTDVTDTVKALSDSSDSIEGAKGTYRISKSAECYRVMMKDGEIDGYKVSVVSALNTGYQVYLYETNGAKGYDIVIYSTKK